MNLDFIVKVAGCTAAHKLR